MTKNASGATVRAILTNIPRNLRLRAVLPDYWVARPRWKCPFGAPSEISG
jgi:hypothetical protein